MSHQVPKRYYISISLFILACVIGALGAAAYFWLNPLFIVIAFVLFGVLPMAFHAATASLFLDPTKTKKALVGESAPKFVDRFRLAVAPVLLLGMLGAGLVAGWFTTTVRKSAIDIATYGRFELSLQRALWDDDGDTVLYACNALNEIGAAPQASRLYEIEQRHGDEPFDCILRGHIQNASRVDMQMLGTRFASEIAKNTDDERACVLSERLRLTARAVPRANIVLLQCALNHDSVAQRTCCAQSIASELTQDGANLVDLLPPVASPESRSIYPLLNDLFRVSFGEDFEDERVRQTTRVDDALTQTYLMETLCHGAQQSMDIDFATIGEHLSCGKTVRLRSPDTARLACSTTAPLSADTFCGRIEVAGIGRTKERAQRLIWKGINDANSPDGGQRIWRGLASAMNLTDGEPPDWESMFEIPPMDDRTKSQPNAAQKAVIKRFISIGQTMKGAKRDELGIHEALNILTDGKIPSLSQKAKERAQEKAKKKALKPTP